MLIRKVAKKIFIGSLQPNETVDASTEASLLKHLDHPAIVKFYDSFVEADFFYIITEYCEVLEFFFIILSSFAMESVSWFLNVFLCVQDN